MEEATGINLQIREYVLYWLYIVSTKGRYKKGITYSEDESKNG